MPLPPALVSTVSGALLVALGSVLNTLLEPILAFLALRGLQLLAKVTKSTEIDSLYKQAVATYNARGGSYVDKAAVVAASPPPQLPSDPPTGGSGG